MVSCRQNRINKTVTSQITLVESQFGYILLRFKPLLMVINKAEINKVPENR